MPTVTCNRYFDFKIQEKEEISRVVCFSLEMYDQF